MTSDLKLFLLNFAISGSAAVVSKTLIAPVERAKFVLQNQDYALPILTGKQKPFKGVLDFYTRIPREQGVLSLWRGNWTNILRYFPSQALNFSLYQFNKNLFSSFVTTKTHTMSVITKFGAGVLAGGCSAAIVFPLDFCQTRLTLDMGTQRRKNSHHRREFNGMLSCFYKIAKHDGVKGLYKGVHVSVVGFAIYRSFYFALYDLTKSGYGLLKAETGDQRDALIMVEPEKLPLILSFLAAEFCTAISGLISYPMDTITRHMMLDSGRPAELRRNPNIRATCRSIYKKYGFYGFYKGALVNLVRCTAGALVLVIYDEFLYYTNWKDKIKT